MSSPEEYRALANHFLAMAVDVGDGWVANLLRLTAGDYIELADQLGKAGPLGQQQQQIQPEEPRTDSGGS